MPKKPDRKPLRSYFETCAKSEEIIACVRRNKGQITTYELYGKVKQIDPNVPTQVAFYKWIKKFEDKREEKAIALLQEMESIDKVDSKDLVGILFKAISNKILQAGNAVMDQEIAEITQCVNEGKQINPQQRERIMKWLFSAIKATTDAKVVDLKVRADQRAETVFDNLFKAAQYGKTSKEAVEGNFEEIIEDEEDDDVDNIVANNDEYGEGE